MTPAPPEVWLRGPLPDIGAHLQPVAHSLMQSAEEVRALLGDLSVAELRFRPAGAASVAYHLSHAAGSLDRLFTYARGEALTPDQLAALAAESAAGDAPDPGALAAAFARAVARALEQLRRTGAESLLERREVGRAKLPSTTIGLLFHAAEHTQRHVGQAVTTAAVARGATRPSSASP